MSKQEDLTLNDITEVIDPAFYQLTKPQDIENYGEDFEGVDDTVIRMVLDAQ